MIKFLYLSLLSLLLFVSCTYNDEETFYNKGSQTDTTLIARDISLVADFRFEENLSDSSMNNIKLNLEGSQIFNHFGYNSNSRGSFYLDGQSSLSFFTGVYDTITISFHMKSNQQLMNLTTVNMSPTILDYGKGAMKFEVDGITGQTFLTLTAGTGKVKFDEEGDIIDTWAEWNFVCIQLTWGKATIKFSNFSYGEMDFESIEKAINYNDGNLIIGKSSSNPSNYFQGNIDDLKVFKRALKKSETDALK